MLICPTIPYGATESLCDYPGTINLGTELLYQVLGRVCDSLFQHGARRFVIPQRPRRQHQVHRPGGL